MAKPASKPTMSPNVMCAFQILSYTGGKIHYYGSWGVSDRFKFTSDPKLGDASVNLTDTRLSDTATYQCKVKKAPGVDTRKVTLVIMGEKEFLFTGWTCSYSLLSLLSCYDSLTWNVFFPMIALNKSCFLCSWKYKAYLE